MRKTGDFVKNGGIFMLIKPYLDEELRQERRHLSPYACFSKDAVRKVPEKEMGLPFEVDRNKIIQSKAFRRMKHKTQVFLNPKGDHYRTRLTHTLEVANISRFIARYLRLNEDLAEAIALGHDIGHAPFAHTGEKVLEEYFGGDYSHNKQSLRVADHIEKLNLTDQVRDGILHHTGTVQPFTLEGQVVKIADRIAYLRHDIDDAIRGKVIVYEDIPRPLRDIFPNLDDVATVLSLDMIENSRDKDCIQMSDEMHKAMMELRTFMFETVYLRPSAQKEIQKTRHVILSLIRHYLKHPEDMPLAFQQIKEEWGLEQAVIDYISGMTDAFAIERYQELFVPRKYDIL